MFDMRHGEKHADASAAHAASSSLLMASLLCASLPVCMLVRVCVALQPLP